MTVRELVSLGFNPASTDPYSDSARGILPSLNRNTIGSSVDLQGNVFTAGPQELRWTKGTNGKFYLALEPTVTNLLTDKSEDFGSWTLDANVFVFSKKQIGPSGKYDADEVLLSTSANTGLSVTNIGNRNSLTLTFSVWLKTTGGTRPINLRLISNSTYTDTKTVTATWVRYSFTQTLLVGDTNTLTAAIFAGDTSAPTIYMYGAQLEISSVATSYIPTTPIFETNGNLIIDGDMELEGVANWVSNDSHVTGKTKDLSVVKFGRQSIKVTVDASSNINQTVTTVIGQTYKVSAWVYFLSGTGPIYLFAINAGQLAAVQGVWTYIEQTFKATGTTHVIAISSSSDAVFYVDSVKCIHQLAPEPSFEAAGTPPSPWANLSATITAETVVVHSGAKAARVTTTAEGQGIKLAQSDISLANNTWYRVDAWIGIISQADQTVVPRIRSTGAINIINQNCKSIVGDWQKVTAIFKTGSLSGSDSLIFDNHNGGALVFVLDDVSILALDAPVVTRNAELLTMPLTNHQPSNLLTYSEDISNAAWTKAGTIVVTADDAVAPNGTTTADKVSFNSNDAQLAQILVSVKASTTYVFSVWLRSDQAKSARILIYDGVALQLITCPVTSRWRRFFVSYTTGVAPLYIAPYVQFESSGINLTLPFSVWVWGAQLEEASSPAQYVKTVASSQPTRFAGIGSSNFNRSQGAISFFGIFPAINVASTNLFGDTVTNALNVHTSGDGIYLLYKIRGLDKTGASVLKSNTIAIIAALGGISPTAEHHVVINWSEERDSNGKLVLLRTQCYFDGALVVNQTYTDIQQWYYDQSAFVLVQDGITNSFIRDLKIFSTSLSTADVSELYTGAYV